MYIPVTVLGVHYLHSVGMRVSDLIKVGEDSADQETPGQAMNGEQPETHDQTENRSAVSQTGSPLDSL